MAREKPNRLPGSPVFRWTLSVSKLKAESSPQLERKAISQSPQVIQPSMKTRSFLELLKRNSLVQEVQSATEGCCWRTDCCPLVSRSSYLSCTHTSHPILPHLRLLQMQFTCQNVTLMETLVCC